MDFKNQSITNKYDIVKMIAQGGQGSVFLAKRKEDGVECALKVFTVDDDDDKGNVRVQREVEITRELEHENIVKIYDDHQFFFEGEDFESYITMEYVDGPDFMDYLKNSFHPRYMSSLLGGYIHIIHSVSSALTYAHQKEILHRDIKPRNILLQIEDGYHTAKLSDFGMAKRAIDYTHTRPGESPGGSTHYQGVEYYLRDAKNNLKYSVDERSDVYALGVTMYNALTGKKPIELKGLGKEPHASAIEYEYSQQIGPYAEKNRYHTSPTSINAAIPQDVSDVCLKATALFPEDRYQTMAEFQQALSVLTEKYPKKEQISFDDVQTKTFMFATGSTLAERTQDANRKVGKEIASFELQGSRCAYTLTRDNKLAAVFSGGMEIHDIHTKEKVTIDHTLQRIRVNEILPVYLKDKETLYLVNGVEPSYSSFFIFDSGAKAMTKCTYLKTETSKDQHLFYYDNLLCLANKGYITHSLLDGKKAIQKKLGRKPCFYEKVGNEIMMGMQKDDVLRFVTMDENIKVKKKIGKIASKIDHFVFNHYDQKMYVLARKNILTPYEITREEVIGRKTTCKQFESLQVPHKVDALYTTLKHIVCKDDNVYHLYRGSSNGSITAVGKFTPNKKEYDEIKIFPESPYIALRKRRTVKIYELE